MKSSASQKTARLSTTKPFGCGVDTTVAGNFVIGPASSISTLTPIGLPTAIGARLLSRQSLGRRAKLLETQKSPAPVYEPEGGAKFGRATDLNCQQQDRGPKPGPSRAGH
jgi:hypothetical protein